MVSYSKSNTLPHQYIFIYLGFYVAFNTVQVISRWVVGRVEETSTYSLLGFCTVNCRPTASNYQLSHLRPCRGSNPGLRDGRRECYHSATVAPSSVYKSTKYFSLSFAHDTPNILIDVPDYVCSETSLYLFRDKLKTYPFPKAYAA